MVFLMDEREEELEDLRKENNRLIKAFMVVNRECNKVLYNNADPYHAIKNIWRYLCLGKEY